MASTEDDSHQKAGPSRPPARPTRSSRHHLEPNPFEQSFSHKPEDGGDELGEDGGLATEDEGGADKVRGGSSRGGSFGGGRGVKDKIKNGEPLTPSGKDAQTPSKRILPPVSSITSPSANETSGHQYWPTSFSSSLRSGPLSPAMLAGPQSSFDPSFRTGFTPDLSNFKTGLTPLGSAGAGSFPPPSPNTAAFLAMVTNSSAPGLSGATITPNTLSALSGNPMDNTSQGNQPTVSSQPAKGGVQQQQQQHSHQQQHESFDFGFGNGRQPSDPSKSTKMRITSGPEGQSVSPEMITKDLPSGKKGRGGKGSNNRNDQNPAPAPAQTNQAASGLFLLSQAHQELAKREDAAAAAAAAAQALHGVPRQDQQQQDGNTLYNNSMNVSNSKQQQQLRSNGSGKRKKDNYGMQAGEPKAASLPKRAKSTKSSGPGSELDSDGEESMMGGEDDDESRRKGGLGGGDDEDKRKNFLERNRQAALKCRQRKKAWLASLQAKVEYLQTDNEHLQGTVSALRNEIMFLKSQLMQSQRQMGGQTQTQQQQQQQPQQGQAGQQSQSPPNGQLANGMGGNPRSMPMSSVSSGIMGAGMPVGHHGMNMIPNVGVSGQYQAHAVPRPTHIPGQYSHQGSPSNSGNTSNASNPGTNTSRQRHPSHTPKREAQAA